MDDFEQRGGGEIRVETRGLARILRGYAIVFDRLSEDLGGFLEKIAPSAVDRTLADGVDLRALAHHNPERVLGRLASGTLRVAKDARGLAVEIDPPAAAADLVESVQRGDITGMSFGFRTYKDAWDFTTDPPTRTVQDMLIREVSVVAFPAYPQTQIALRSMGAARLVSAGAAAPPQTVSSRLSAAGRKFPLTRGGSTGHSSR